MELKIYLKPTIKVLDTKLDELLFEIGGGSLDPNPDTPGVNPAKEFDDDVWGDTWGDVWGADSWTDSEEDW